MALRKALFCVVTALMITHAFPSFADGLIPDPSVPKPGDLLLGDAGDACQMLVCLSDLAQAKLLPDCSPPLKRYWDMKPHDRPGFLGKCPKKAD
jgi:hypothetical protein